MTLSDPLLKELKGHIAKLVLESTPPYGDQCETVFLLCHCIEAIFLKGLVRHDGFTPWKTDSFAWFYQLVRKYHRVIPLQFKIAFEDVLNDPKTRTQTGKTRLLIRTLLKRKCLQIPVEFHVENRDYDDTSLRISYNKNCSILGHEILSQIFLSLIQQLSHYEFTFDLRNSSFLDESWQIPQIVKVEFVPCEKLGLTLGFPMGFAVIVDIIEHSMAAEMAGTIAVGDIMDEFNGISLRNYYGPKIETLFRKNRGKPFKLTFIKATDTKGQLYLPTIKLYRILGLDPEKLAHFRKQKEADEVDLESTNVVEDESQKCLQPPSTSPKEEAEPQLIQDLLGDDVSQNPVPNLMDDLTLLPESDQGQKQNVLLPSPIKPQGDSLVDIDLNSPDPVWDAISELDSSNTPLEDSTPAETKDQDKSTDKSTNSGCALHSREYVDNSEPFMV